MGSACGRSKVAVTPAKLTTEVNIIWLGPDDAPWLTTLRQQCTKLHVFENVDHSIQMINALPPTDVGVLYVVSDTFEDGSIKSVLNKVAHLTQVHATYIYHDNTDITNSDPSYCPASTGNHLVNRAKLMIEQLGATRVSVFKASTTSADRVGDEDVRLVISENCLNALLNSIEVYQFVVGSEQFKDVKKNVMQKKDKRTNATWKMDVELSKMRIFLQDSGEDKLSDTVKVSFTATAKATPMGSLPLGIGSVETTLSRESPVKGDALITFDPETNKFYLKIKKAIVARIEFWLGYKWKDYDIKSYLDEKYKLAISGPVNFLQEIPLTATTEAKKTNVTITRFSMQSHNKYIVLTSKLEFQTTSE